MKAKKFLTQDGEAFETADWIAGVEQDHDSNDDDSDDDDDQDDESIGEIDRDEINDILAEQSRWKRSVNPNNHEDNEVNDQDIIGDGQGAEDGDNLEIEDAALEGVTVSDIASEVSTEVRRSARDRHAPARFDPAKGLSQAKLKGVKFNKSNMKDLEFCHNIMVDKNKASHEEYDPEIAGVAARYIHMQNEKSLCFGQQFILQKGLKKFGDKSKEWVRSELGQLHDRTCFNPVLIHELSKDEKIKAQEGLMFLTEKRDGSGKGRLVYNGKPTRAWHDREDSASPTVSLESIFLTATIDAKEGRDVMTADIPNAFIQATMPALEEGEERVFMKLTGILVDLLVECAPEIYGPYVGMENGR